MRKKVLVYSDVSGHYYPLLKSLNNFGITESYIPNDVHVIFNGDLIHRGPHSLEVLHLVDNLYKKFPNNINIIMGNHESFYLKEARYKFSGYSLDEESISILHRWFEEKIFRIAVGTRSHLGDLLISHAGLTYGFWEKIGSPITVQECTKILNSLDWGRNSILWNAGEMITNDVNRYAGPLWASDAREFLPGWYLAEKNDLFIPFGQVHGHASIYDWNRNSFRAKDAIINRIHVNKKKRHTTSIFKNQFFVGSDPDHSSTPADFWEPFVIDNARVFV